MHRQRAHSGFTLMETIGVVALIAIVMAFAAPNVISLRDSMRMKELDSCAQQVYNAAQYRLTSLQAAALVGTQANARGGSDPTLAIVAEKAAAAGADVTLLSDSAKSDIPSDYPGSHDSSSDYWENRTLYAAFSECSLVEDYLAPDKGTPISNALKSGGCFIIEFSPTTAEVYSVFYWEHDNATMSSSFSQDYATACSLRTDSRSRAQAALGYYHGGEVSALETATATNEEKPASNSFFRDGKDNSVEAITGREELYYSLTNLREGSSVTVTITGKRRENNNWGTWRHTYEGDELNTFTANGVLCADIILDSMRSDSGDWGFDAITGDTFMHGTNVDITITVKVPDASNPGMYVTETRSYKSVNPYFEWADPDTGEVHVSAVRHINNLREQKMSDTTTRP